MFSALALTMFSACLIQTETVPGPEGDPGPPGATTVILDGSAVSVQDLADVVAAQQQAIAALQAQVQALTAIYHDCPAGYAKAAAPFVLGKPESVLCKRDKDEVVRVGAGGAAFWVDRYEASIWDGPTQRFAGGDDSSPIFPKNGQGSVPWVARSLPGQVPASRVTWFQAQAACRAAGKRLPTAEEWLAAARGTFDPDTNVAATGKNCNTKATPGNQASVRKTASGADPSTSDQKIGCFSDWGAEDMIGNLSEITSEWFASVFNLGLSTNGVAIDEPDTLSLVAWSDASYGNDKTWGILSAPGTPAGAKRGLPSQAFHGGNFEDGTDAGLFTLDISWGPIWSWPSVGFRCLLPR